MLAKEEEHLIGPMSEVPEFRKALDGAIASGHALAAVVSSDDGAEELAGGTGAVTACRGFVAGPAALRSAAGAGGVRGAKGGALGWS